MNVLFLCTGNSARSILGEVIFNDLFSKYGHAYSAGSKPVGKVNLLAKTVLEKHGHDIANLKSQPVDDFIDHGIDLVIGVCESATNDCPVWLGKDHPKRLYWPLPDPKTKVDFEKTYLTLKDKISAMISNL